MTCWAHTRRTTPAFTGNIAVRVSEVIENKLLFPSEIGLGWNRVLWVVTRFSLHSGLVPQKLRKFSWETNLQKSVWEFLGRGGIHRPNAAKNTLKVVNNLLLFGQFQKSTLIYRHFYDGSGYNVILIQLCQKLCEQHVSRSLVQIQVTHYHQNYKDCEALMIQVQVHTDKLEGHMICVNLCTFSWHCFQGIVKE